MMQPLLLGYILHYFRGEGHASRVESYYFVGGLIGTLILSPIIRRPLQYNTQLLGMKVRVAVSSLLYDKVNQMHLNSELCNYSSVIFSGESRKY